MATSVRYSKNNRIDDFNYFVKNYKKFYKKYGHSFVVIKNKNLLGAYGSHLLPWEKSCKVSKF